MMDRTNAANANTVPEMATIKAAMATDDGHDGDDGDEDLGERGI